MSNVFRQNGSSGASLVERVYQAREHFGDLLEIGFEFQMILRLKKPAAFGQFKKRHTFLNRSAGDAEEVLSITNGEPTIPFGDVGSYRKGRSGMALSCKRLAFQLLT
jgi:hypothetical protein